MKNSSPIKRKSRGRPQESALWSITNCAKHLDVNPTFYRRNILNLPSHPPPVDSTAGQLFWWRKMIVPWLDEPSNLIRNEDKWEETSNILASKGYK